MNLEKLAPWNWFKKEEEQESKIVPVRHNADAMRQSASLHDLHREFDRMLDTIRHGFTSHWPTFHSDTMLNGDWFKPSLDIASSEKTYTVNIELPGIDANDINIEISGNTMRIKGEKHQESEEKGKDFYRVERSYGSFERILDLPEDADADTITSNYKDGVLNIDIPKKALPEIETKKVPVNIK